MQQLPSSHAKHQPCKVICPGHLQVFVKVYHSRDGVTAVQGHLQQQEACAESVLCLGLQYDAKAGTNWCSFGKENP